MTQTETIDRTEYSDETDALIIAEGSITEVHTSTGVRIEFDTGDTVHVRGTDGSGDNLRGFTADAVVSLTSVPARLRENVIEPMLALKDRDLIEL